MDNQRAASGRGAGGDYFRQYLHRTILLLGDEPVQALRGKTVAIAGCGGHGGAACLTLARMGVGGFVLADPNPFDEPDINRQWGANLKTLGRNKAQVYEEMLRSINPEIAVRTYCDGVTEQNVKEFARQADVLIDCLDVAVPGSLRARMFAEARDASLHAATAGNLGFGGFVAVASPDGMPMEVLAGFEDDVIGESSLPPLFREVFVPEYVDQVDKHLRTHRVPSVAVAPALLGTILSVETVLVLLGATIPGWRPPICLPHFLLVDLMRMKYRVVHADEFLRRPTRSAKPADEVVPASPPPAPAVVAAMRERQDLLSKVGHNTNLLPDDAVEVDLLTDSWSEIGLPQGEEETAAREQAIAPSEEILRGLYGYKHFVTVFRGRFAEAILARSLAGSGGIVLSNGLFPTTRFHMESVGFDVRELPSPEAYDPRSEAPFKGDLDLEALKNVLGGPEGPRVKAVYLELCVNALGGHPVSVANLRAVREMTSGRGVLVILDATRAFENAVLIREREPGYADKPLARIVRELCSYSDCTASSCTKDFRTAVGGFVGTNDPAHSTRIGDLTLAFGDGLSGGSREALRRALWRFAEWNLASAQRVAMARRLWESLRRASVPVIAPAGGYGVFVDVRAFLPHIPPEQYPTQALANALFVASGVRASGNLGTPEQARRGIELLRLAIPIARYSEDALRPVIAAFGALVRNPDRVRGLKRIGGPPGMIGQFAAFYRPVAKA